MACRAQTPYAGLSEAEIMRCKLSARADLAAPAGCPPQLGALLGACLARDPARRPSAGVIASELRTELSLLWGGGG